MDPYMMTAIIVILVVTFRSNIAWLLNDITDLILITINVITNNPVLLVPIVFMIVMLMG